MDAICRLFAENPYEYDIVGVQVRRRRSSPSFLPVVVLSLPSTHPRTTRSNTLVQQELFHADSRVRLETAMHRGGLRHSMHFLSGADMPVQSDGCGVAVYSRFPIVETSFLRFSTNGRPTHVHHWDWHVGKGVGLARVLAPHGPVDVYVAHLVAQYQDHPDDEYEGQRLVQAFEMAQFIRTTRKSTLCVVLADLNTAPDSLPFRVRGTLGRSQQRSQQRSRRRSRRRRTMDPQPLVSFSPFLAFHPSPSPRLFSPPPLSCRRCCRR